MTVELNKLAVSVLLVSLRFALQTVVLQSAEAVNVRFLSAAAVNPRHFKVFLNQHGC